MELFLRAYSQQSLFIFFLCRFSKEKKSREKKRSVYWLVKKKKKNNCRLLSYVKFDTFVKNPLPPTCIKKGSVSLQGAWVSIGIVWLFSGFFFFCKILNFFVGSPVVFPMGSFLSVFSLIRSCCGFKSQQSSSQFLGFLIFSPRNFGLPNFFSKAFLLSNFLASLF